MKNKTKIFRWNEVKNKTEIIVGTFHSDKIMKFDGTKFKILRRKHVKHNV